MPVPAALRASVLRRLRALEIIEREILLRASAIGREFDLALAVAAADRADEAVHAALERARALQFLEALAADRYSFRHALTREIIYGELLGEHIPPLHRRIAKALEVAFEAGEPVLEALAHHAWTGRDARRGLRYNELAGDNAAAVHAYEDARRYYRRARSLIEIGSLGYGRLTEKLRAFGEV